MDNQAQQVQQMGLFSSGFFGSLQSASSGFSPFREPVVSQQFAQARQQFAQARQQMALSNQILATQVARERANDAGLLGLPIQCASVRRRVKKPKDYSEHLTRKDEKILPIAKR